MTDRAERRRAARAEAKGWQYHHSGFRGGKTSRFNGDLRSDETVAPDFGRSRYMPHVGAKQRAKGRAKIDAALVASMGMKEGVS